jgi:hypothetical protein
VQLTRISFAIKEYKANKITCQKTKLRVFYKKCELKKNSVSINRTCDMFKESLIKPFSPKMKAEILGD